MARARCSSHQLPAFVVGTKYSHQLPRAKAVSCSARQLLRRSPLTYQSCHTRAAADLTPAEHTASKHRRSSKGVLHAVEHRRQRCRFCCGARSSSSVGVSRCSCDGSADGVPGGDDLSAAFSESEPLVQQVAAALEQRCSVRGGDLVSIVRSMFCGTGTAQPP